VRERELGLYRHQRRGDKRREEHLRGKGREEKEGPVEEKKLFPPEENPFTPKKVASV